MIRLCAGDEIIEMIMTSTASEEIIEMIINHQEKISISAGGALAFDTVNLLINTFSSLVR